MSDKRAQDLELQRDFLAGLVRAIAMDLRDDGEEAEALLLEETVTMALEDPANILADTREERDWMMNGLG